MDTTAPVSSRDDAVADTLRRQAASCAFIGSPLYAHLLEGLCADYVAGGISYEVLHGVTEQPVHDALGLRYLATAHRLALEGSAPELAAAFESCGGAWSGEDLVPAFCRTVEANRDAFADGLRRNVQTNEVGRAAVLASGFSLISLRHKLPLAIYEVGSSAGLLSHWMHIRFDTGISATGPADSALTFDSTWWRPPAPMLDANLTVTAAHASDISPIDVSDPAGRNQMMSFVWPDQRVRRERLQAAIDVALAHPLRVEQADAGQWIADALSGPLPQGVATVVFHSIVWQYLPAATRTMLRGSLQRAGEGATSASPLLWLRMEPDTLERAELRLTTWPGGEDELIAYVGYHGSDITWLVAEPA